MPHENRDFTAPQPSLEAGADERGWLWPAAIVGGLLLVVAVNVGFAFVALSGADEIVESYVTEKR